MHGAFAGAGRGPSWQDPRPPGRGARAVCHQRRLHLPPDRMKGTMQRSQTWPRLPDTQRLQLDTLQSSTHAARFADGE